MTNQIEGGNTENRACFF